MLEGLGRTLMWVGGAIVVLGLVIFLIGTIPGIGRLPGDILIRRDKVSVYIPLGTMLLVSVLLTLALNLIARIRR